MGIEFMNNKKKEKIPLHMQKDAKLRESGYDPIWVRTSAMEKMRTKSEKEALDLNYRTIKSFLERERLLSGEVLETEIRKVLNQFNQESLKKGRIYDKDIRFRVEGNDKNH